MSASLSASSFLTLSVVEHAAAGSSGPSRYAHANRPSALDHVEYQGFEDEPEVTEDSALIVS